MTNPLFKKLGSVARQSFRFRIIGLCMTWGVLCLGTTLWCVPEEKRKLKVEEVMELLTGGVALPRITYLVKEHGVDFSLTQTLERAFVDLGAHTDLILALQQAAAPFVTSDSFLPPRSGPEPVRRRPPEAPKNEHLVPTAADTAQLRIRSKPGNVLVFLDDKLIGETDSENGRLTISELKPGTHELRATRDGYDEVKGTVELRAGEVLETPVWLGKSKTSGRAAEPAEPIPSGTKFLVRHHHIAYAGTASAGHCDGWLVVNVGYIRYVPTTSPHKYLLNTSEIRDVKAGSRHGTFRIKLDFGRNYSFAALDSTSGKIIDAGPVLAEIGYSRGR